NGHCVSFFKQPTYSTNNSTGNKTTSGIYVTMINTMIKAMICGIKYLNILGTEICAIDDVTKRHTPKGGVTIPMVKFTDITIPKCMGSIPAASTKGKNNGVKIETALIVSINVPAINKIMLIIKRSIIGLSATLPNISII